MIKQVSLSCILFSLLVWSNVSIAQTDKELEFNVVKKKVEIGLKPGYRFLYQNIAHPIEIIINDSVNQYSYKLAGGSIMETDSGTFITPEAKGVAILNIYEIRKGKEILIRSKKFAVLPEPKPYLRNKPTDNFMVDVLLLSGKLKGITTLSGKKIAVEVKSFTVVYMGKNNNFKSVNIIGNELSKEVCKEMLKLPNGSLIYFEKIMIELIPGYNAMIQSYRVTMETTNSKDLTNFGVGN
jgi:hypothetical protein